MAKVRKIPLDDDYFRKFAVSLERAIAKYGDLDEETLVQRQKRQIDTLVDLENRFRHTLIKHSWGPAVYRRFVKTICDEKKNILAARPYFRERQKVFTKEIAKALKLRADVSLYKFKINFQFVMFAMKAKKWPPNGKLAKIAWEIARLRTELVEMNMPLAISRARLFWGGTPRAHLTYMDMVQIACEGLMAAIDKFELPYSQAFRHTAIGRMLGNLIENYSETLIHFYPSDKRKLYRANKLVKEQSTTTLDYDKLARGVNEWPGADGVTTNASEIANLMAAASCVSADQHPHAPAVNVTGDVHHDWAVESSVDRFASDRATQPDVQVEDAQAQALTRSAMLELTLFEKKLLRMRGVAL